MSICQKLAALEKAGKIERFVPQKTGRPARRRLYLACQAIKDFNDPQSATNLLRIGGFVEAAMTRWVLGERVYGLRRGEFLDRLRPPPPEVWEIRVTAPTPQVRLFGRFCEIDTLILTNFHTRSFLGKKGSAGWKTAMKTCVEHWEKCLAGLPLHTGNTIGDYVSENCDAFPI